MAGRRVARGLLAGSAAFFAASMTLVAGTGLLVDWQPPALLAPLDPDGAADPGARGAASISTRTLELEGHETPVHALLTSPREGADTAVVLVAGAGSADRTALLPLAERLARFGMAALTYDKRRDGYSLLHRDFDRLADDALLAAAELRGATGATRVGLLGVSEGGWVASAAARSPDVAPSFIVLLSAPVVSPLEQVAWTADNALRETPDLVRRAVATTLAGGRAVIDYLDFDTTAALDATDVPILAIWGAEDSTVPVNEAYRRLKEARPAHLSAQILPSVGHDLLAAPSTWLPSATDWMHDPGGSALTGAEPASRLGVSAVPPLTRLADPRLHLLIATAAALGTAAALSRPMRPRRRTGSTS